MIEITAEYLASQGLSKTFPKRFWKKVNKTDSCWLWTGYCLSNGLKKGYGTISTGIGQDAKVLAHRASWIIHFGPIPEDKCVLHNCPDGDNRSCVHPEHLWLGDHRYNAIDAVNKGVQLGGSIKLSQNNVEDIKVLYATGRCSHEALGRMFGVSGTCIRNVVTGISWQ